VLAMVAEFESDLIGSRTREGMAIAKAKGHLCGEQPKLSLPQQRHLMEVYRAGAHTTAELAELFNVARSTVYRTVQRQEGALAGNWARSGTRFRLALRQPFGSHLDFGIFITKVLIEVQHSLVC
jgi:DNA invertase Pin-like site-specific DNA recombinase